MSQGAQNPGLIPHERPPSELPSQLTASFFAFFGPRKPHQRQGQHKRDGEDDVLAVRLEHDYLITSNGCQRISHHQLGLI